ncbi:reverse transcriptase domain-containing protein [Tanacetum coccineum]
MRTCSSLEYTIPRRRNRRRSRQQQEEIPIVPDPIPMADDRPMAEQLQAPTGGVNVLSSSILLPYLSKTTNLRNEITNFRQIAQESFSEAWERFKELLRKCPHHGFSLMHQLDTFYNSLSYNDQDSLNSAAGGNFLYKSPTEGLQIIENKAKVRCSRNAVMRVSTNAPPSSSTSSSSNFEFQQMAAALEDKMTLTFRNEMNEMKNMMKALVPTPIPIKAVEERCTTCGSNHSYNVCPMTRGGYEYPVYHDNFQQFQQTASVGNFVQNGNSGYRPPNLANQIRPPGFNQQNNNRNVNANQGYNRTGNNGNQVNHGANSGLTQQAQAYQAPVAQVPVAYSRVSNTITNPRCEARAITTRSGLSYTPVPPMPPPYVNPDNEDGKETEVTKDKLIILGKDKLKDNEKGMNEKEKDDEVRDSVFEEILIDKEEFFLPKSPPIRPNKPTKNLLPYPSRVEYEKKDLMPLRVSKDVKSLLSNKEKLNEMANTPLGLPALQSTRMTLELANCSLCVPKGIARDVLVPVGRLTFPADFVVVDFECDYRVPLILGRPFLRTARTLIDVFGEEMSLRTDEERLIISLRSEELKYTTRPHKESVCMIDIFSSPKEKDEDPNAIFTIPTKEDLTNAKVEKHEVKTCNLSREISSICPSIKERLNFWKKQEVFGKA